MGRKKKTNGEEAFLQYYASIYTSRWPSLREALLEEKPSFFTHEGLLKNYFLDEASLLPPRLLDVHPGMDVIDFCAAPGGKSLQLARALQGKGSLCSNDLSPQRAGRLRKVLDEHLRPEDRKVVRVSCRNAENWKKQTGLLADRILLDAPCSSERHVLDSPSALAEWTPGRPKNLHFRQVSLLASAVDALKENGIVVYSTCSIHPMENDGVIAKIFKKRKGKVEPLPLQFSWGEPTEHGWIVLPDQSEGRGPLYLAGLKRI